MRIATLSPTPTSHNVDARQWFDTTYHDESEAIETNLALTNQLVSIDIGLEVGLAIVEMQALQPLESNDTIELAHCLVICFACAQIVARCKQMASVQTHSNTCRYRSTSMMAATSLTCLSVSLDIDHSTYRDLSSIKSMMLLSSSNDRPIVPPPPAVFSSTTVTPELLLSAWLIPAAIDAILSVTEILPVVEPVAQQSVDGASRAPLGVVRVVVVVRTWMDVELWNAESFTSLQVSRQCFLALGSHLLSRASHVDEIRAMR
jgi:hypothetical protein